jgi:Tol biopolymer transport system component
MKRAHSLGSMALLALLTFAARGAAQRGQAQLAGGEIDPGNRGWDVTLARGKTREIDFTTSEGTWMSPDLSPDGRWIAFDLLGHIYRMPSAGGEAQPLTQNSGVALNFQPRISPDGKTIAFISDRRGQYNLWLMDADGSNPRPVFTDLNVTAAEPAWTPDGQYIVVRRGGSANPDAPGPGSAGGLYMYHKDGGQGIQLVASSGGRGAGGGGGAPAWPTVSTDGRYLYYQTTVNVADHEPLSGAVQLRRFDFRTGDVIDVTAGESSGAAAGRLSSGGAAAPEVSPDGRWLAFARQIPDATLNYKGHKFGPRTALWLRDLKTGAERLLMDPIEPMVGSGSKTLGILPRYKWAPDGKSVLITQGGKLRRVDVASGNVATVPFTAHVHRTISEMARKQFRITDDVVQAKFIRWPSASADGKTIAFVAIGRIYVQDGATGRPRRVTAASFTPLEYAPTWSPDGRWLAFVTFDDTARGHLWKVAVTGGTPQRLTKDAADLVDPVWSPDGRSIIVARGAGATAAGRTITANPYYDLVRIAATPAAGGDTGEVVTTVGRPSESSLSGEARRQLLRPSFGPEGRLFYPEERAAPASQVAAGGRGGGGTALVSVKPDGSDREVHVTLPNADEIVPSPDGSWVAFQEGDNVYVAPMKFSGAGGEPIRIDKKRGELPVTRLTRDGGLFPHWRDKNTLEFGSANQFFVRHLDTGATDTVTLSVSVPRAVPTGSVALTGARLVTLDHKKVVDSGTIVIRGSRIACVGTCSTAGVDRVIDARGKTIIPGWVDMHAHHHREWRGMRPKHDYEVAMYLAYGITTDLDPSMWSQNIFPTAELIEAGEIIGPRTFSTGDPLTRGDGARSNELSNQVEAQHAVRKMVEWGATEIKQYAQPRRDQRQWVSDAARQIGANVTAEGGFFLEDIGMIMDGQTGWEHAFSEVPMYSDGAKFLGKAGATYSPTLVVAGPGPWSIEYFYQASDVWKDAKQRRWFPWRMLIPQTRVRWLRPETDYAYPFIAQAMADVIAEGGNGALGSHGEHHGLDAHWEVWMEASALGNMGALETASLGGARFLGADQDIGSLEVGKLADLMVLNANPLDDIHNTVNMQYVMKGGVLYDAGTLDEIWPKRVPFGPFYWVNPDALQVNDKAVDVFDKK